MKVSEVMTSPAVTCRSDATATAVTRLMEHYNVGSVVVVDEDERVVGLVTDRDLALRVIATERDGDQSVERVMTRTVFTIAADDDVLDAVKRLASLACRRLPAVDGAGAVVGVITYDTLTALLSEQLALLASVARNEQARATGLLPS